MAVILEQLGDATDKMYAVTEAGLLNDVHGLKGDEKVEQAAVLLYHQNRRILIELLQMRHTISRLERKLEALNDNK